MEASALMRPYKVELLKQLPQDYSLIFKWFIALTELNRPSYHTKEAMATVIEWFKKMGATAEPDTYGNCLFTIPATPGKENVPSLVIQGHLDIVAVGKFEEGGKVPLKIENGYLTSGVSTIGSDDGIAVAVMLALCEDKDKFEHGPLEFLVTVDEEVGLYGATKLPGPPYIKSRALLNIDSEEWDTFYTSCAGGINMFYEYDVHRDEYAGKTLKVAVTDFVSGHTGLMINEGRANAVKWMVRLLQETKNTIPFRLVDIAGGDKHNAIPESCVAHVVVENVDAFKAKMTELHQAAYNEYKAIEKKNPKINFEEVEAKKAMTEADSTKILDLITTLYHGVWMMHPEIKGLVNTSQSVSVTKFDGDHLFINVFARTNEVTQMEFLINTAEAVGRMAGVTVRIPKDEMVKPWPAALTSRITDSSVSAFEKLYGKKPNITGIHAGLECGAIQNQGYPDLEAISFGPEIHGAHTVNEEAEIASCCKCYQLALEIVKEWAK
ncbi:Clan MH, family M20, peptidase T-like metallopeptidase [Trichomonas vaginalis G3]|uniref:Clan MH, family M20, peptidase T-like metallopeptidase n=1 Tax=Trichomonas vaginalis (strain ATCC PRA-98 / G3) TaxID=412133 RepID=A2EZN6_TRIV3|nr:cytosolix non-specific dipeptidase family [Trichomonas vaginalis G3]EAY01874.1 Clan MH, family M20, peptidase T-like metallopeptidase [Trichomonas vaginalis G3]KAI5549673.1 cytosolix non-specific dipeptidase family [Trichomonas vaginalis G3]|eukprot:XP_001314418.1 Clan MH, family M20, peptidase T-like metallopeptidase [Trichomonas vaginalis G3]